MVRNLYNLCKPGGRIVGIGSSPKCPPEKLEKEKKYGRFYTIDDNYFNKNGSQYLVRIVDEEANLDITLVLNWYAAEHYEKVFKQIGF